MNPFRRLTKSLGPGFITGAADDDPSGILTYLQTGAVFGYRQLWTMVLSIPFMTAIQEMCGRIGLVTGQGLAAVIRTHYPRWILYVAVFLLVTANTVNIGANLGAMASVAELLTGYPLILWLFNITLITIVLQVTVSYATYARFLKYLTLSLAAYVITLLVVKQDWPMIARDIVVPRFSLDREYLMNIVAIFGTTISPYLFFWQASEEVEEAVQHRLVPAFGLGRPRIDKSNLRAMRIDTGIGMAISNLVGLCIMITAASTLHTIGISDIDTAVTAVESLRPVVGPSAALLFSIGIIGTGFLSVPVLAGAASYAVSETLDLPEGLSKKAEEAKGFYAIIALATGVGALLNLAGIPPFKLLYYTAILNGLCAPILMALILRITGRRDIMDGYTNGRVSTILGWLITIFMTMAGVALLVMI